MDDEGKSQTAGNVVINLITKQKVVALISVLSTQPVTVAVLQYGEYGVPMITPPGV